MAISMPALPSSRQGLWLAALLTAVLCGWTAWREQESLTLSTQEAVPGRQAGTTVPTALVISPSEPGSLLERDPMVESKTDLFRYISFQLPVPKALAPPPSLPPPKPSAPTFPYQYFGRMVDVDGRTVTYLTRGDTLIPIHARQLLDNTYRIDAVTETQIVVTYVPLEEKIVIAVQTGN
ncbi:hypothetical protein [Janthinobacterium lividum]|uniref:hypothetical protein n=1 Tax=Janthinobacterium lividum TaxID=29581 RepID=UPI000893D384|nr:hypothetical protein [Janthinobacterium lividum]MCC7716725.1 hypothetical protein [Janthinobacterium lividum]OEZ54267.1 hypothetical protein JANLI_39290 [Janthinobacterium lividum]WQE31793.1 hypothetical protein U0004_29715 [Janthinobacterium lividum]STS86061.1 Uncharacterised protein [Janthinobacterium lividum]